MAEEQPNPEAPAPEQPTGQIRMLLAKTGILFAIGWSLFSALLNVIETFGSSDRVGAASAYASAATQSLLVFVVSIWVLHHLRRESAPTWKQAWSWAREKARS